jgi:hypothetical protein
MTRLSALVAQLSIPHLKAPITRATHRERLSKLPNAKRIRRTLRASNSVAESYAPGVSLTSSERKELAESRKQNTQADTAASLARVSKPTPKQLQKLLISEAKKAALQARKKPESN